MCFEYCTQGWMNYQDACMHAFLFHTYIHTYLLPRSHWRQPKLTWGPFTRTTSRDTARPKTGSVLTVSRATPRDKNFVIRVIPLYPHPPPLRRSRCSWLSSSAPIDGNKSSCYIVRRPLTRPIDTCPPLFLCRCSPCTYASCIKQTCLHKTKQKKKTNDFRTCKKIDFLLGVKKNTKVAIFFEAMVPTLVSRVTGWKKCSPTLLS
jgi:hypothetical protein